MTALEMLHAASQTVMVHKDAMRSLLSISDLWKRKDAGPVYTGRTTSARD